MKTVFLALAVTASAIAPDSTHALTPNEGLSRQVESLRSALQSYANSINPRLQALEQQLIPCDSHPYGSLRYEDCSAPTMTGFILRQCKNGDWVKEVDSCHAPKQLRQRYVDPGLTTPASGDILLTRKFLNQFPPGTTLKYPQRGMSPDVNTLNAFCRGEGYLGARTDIQSLGYSSCGDENLVYSFGGLMIWPTSWLGICRRAKSFTCTNVSTEVAVPAAPNTRPSAPLPPPRVDR